MDEHKEDFMLQNKVHATRREEIELWLIGEKGQIHNKSKWIKKSRVEELYTPIYFIINYETKCFLIG